MLIADMSYTQLIERANSYLRSIGQHTDTLSIQGVRVENIVNSPSVLVRIEYSPQGSITASAVQTATVAGSVFEPGNP